MIALIYASTEDMSNNQRGKPKKDLPNNKASAQSAQERKQDRARFLLGLSKANLENVREIDGISAINSQNPEIVSVEKGKISNLEGDRNSEIYNAQEPKETNKANSDALNCVTGSLNAEGIRDISEKTKVDDGLEEDAQDYLVSLDEIDRLNAGKHKESIVKSKGQNGNEENNEKIAAGKDDGVITKETDKKEEEKENQSHHMKNSKKQKKAGKNKKDLHSVDSNSPSKQQKENKNKRQCAIF